MYSGVEYSTTGDIVQKYAIVRSTRVDSSSTLSLYSTLLLARERERESTTTYSEREEENWKRALIPCPPSYYYLESTTAAGISTSTCNAVTSGTVASQHAQCYGS